MTGELRSVGELLSERGKTHGEYADHAQYTQSIKAFMRGTRSWNKLNDMQREALEMIAHKVGRILAGDPSFRDHWDDIAGYARLVAERVTTPSDYKPTVIGKTVADINDPPRR